MDNNLLFTPPRVLAYPRQFRCKGQDLAGSIYRSIVMTERENAMTDWLP